MAQSTPHIPQHVSALLSHLTSRPGVQSTLILSRKDGSIIQSTGLLAATSTTPLGSNSAAALGDDTNNANVSADLTPSRNRTNSTTTDTGAATLPSGFPPSSSSTTTLQESAAAGSNFSSPQNNQQQQQQPYRPSQAETLAAHIFAFMTSASGLAFSLSGSESTTTTSATTLSSRATGPLSNGDMNSDLSRRPRAATNGISEHDTQVDNPPVDRTQHERDEDDEIKLLRLRTKKNEIVVVPDRKYLLCVVHDASGSGGSSSTNGGATR